MRLDPDTRVRNCALCKRIDPPCGWWQPLIVVTTSVREECGLVCHDCETFRRAERAPLVGGD